MKRLVVLVDALEGQRRKGRMVAEFHRHAQLTSTSLPLIVTEPEPSISSLTPLKTIVPSFFIVNDDLPQVTS